MSESLPNPSKSKTSSVESKENQKHQASTQNQKKVYGSISDNTLAQSSIKQRLLGKVKSWSGKDRIQKRGKDKSCLNVVELDLTASLNSTQVSESGNVSPTIRARDSLDSFIKDEQNMPRNNLDDSLLHPSLRKTPNSPKSSPTLGEKWKPSTSKGFAWDPYDRQVRKNKKEHKKQVKKCKSPKKDEKTKEKTQGNKDTTSNQENMEEEPSDFHYQYSPKNSKSVIFTNEVFVVYFNKEDVVGESKEPLKKELEQQTRNKEMRRCHLIKTQERYNLCLF